MKTSSVAVAALVVGLLALVPARPAAAGGVVGNGNRSTCTEAALDAALAGGGSVTFNCGTRPSTITVTTTKTISADTSLDGGGRLTLDGGGKVSILTVDTGVSLTVNRTTFSHGNNTASGGGAIATRGALTVTNSNFSYNTAAYGGAIYSDGFGSPLILTASTFSRNSSTGGGGAIYNDSGDNELSVANCTFSGNVASNGFGGGAIATFSTGQVTVGNSTFSYNVASNGSGGGAIATGGDLLSVTNCTFSRNVAGPGIFQGGGGAIYLSTDGVAEVSVANSTFSYNRVYLVDEGGDVGNGGGAIFNGSNNELTVSDSSFSYNTVDSSAIDSPLSTHAGGAIASIGYDFTTLTVTNSTFSRNYVNGGGKGGGAIYSIAGNALTVSNSSFSGNGVSYEGNGGAIVIFDYSGTLLNVTNSTFSRNNAGRTGHGGAIALEGDPDLGGLTLQNTIIANSTRGGNCAGGTFIDGGHNLRWPLKDTSCVGTIGNPKLGVLKKNGGLTKTLALKLGSAAINAGDNAICAAPPVNNLDQRGFVRPGAGSTNCSIGAYEYNAVAP